MSIETLRDYIEQECDEELIFESSVAITCNQDKYYFIPKGKRPPKEVLERIDRGEKILKGFGTFYPIPLASPDRNTVNKKYSPGGAGVPIKQHLVDRIWADKTDKSSQ